MRPDFEVVGAHEVAPDAAAKDGIHPLTEVARLTWIQLLHVHQPVQALKQGVSREMADIVLEGIGDPSIHHPNPALAQNVGEVVAEELIYQRVEIRIVREHDVSANVVRESSAVLEARGETANVGMSLVNRPIRVAHLLHALFPPPTDT